MKRFILAFLVVSASVVPLTWAAQEKAVKVNPCANVDPTGVLASVTAGDFELSVDPDDAAQHMIFLSNVKSGASSIVVAQMDGVTGNVVAGSLTTVARNYLGNPIINGPEFIRTTDGRLGLIYAGTGGVHGVFRNAPPAQWNAFLYDFNGARVNGLPPILSNTSAGAYPSSPPSPPDQQNTYPQYFGTCSGLCYGYLGSTSQTDVFAVLLNSGWARVTMTTQATTDGYVFVGGCDRIASCGIYEVQIDGVGGLSSVTKVASVPSGVGGPPGQLSAERHPLTGTTVLFTTDGATLIDVWEQTSVNAPLTLLAKVPVPGSGHYRANSSNTQVVLNYLIDTGTDAGSYTIPVSATGSTLSVGVSKKQIQLATGVEYDWFPAAGQWAITYGSRTGPGLTRCWGTP